MYKPLSSQTIEAAMLEVANTPEDDIDYLTDQMREEQPAILDYLYRLDKLPFGFEEYLTLTEAEMEFILYLGVITWKALKKSSRPMRLVTREMLEATIDESERYFTRLARKPPAAVQQAAMLMIQTHPEPELLRFVVQALYARDNEEVAPMVPLEHHQTVVMIFEIIIKAIVDSADRKPLFSSRVN